jgi:glutaredoxin
MAVAKKEYWEMWNNLELSYKKSLGKLGEQAKKSIDAISRALQEILVRAQKIRKREPILDRNEGRHTAPCLFHVMTEPPWDFANKKAITRCGA